MKAKEVLEHLAENKLTRKELQTATYETGKITIEMIEKGLVFCEGKKILISDFNDGFKRFRHDE